MLGHLYTPLVNLDALYDRPRPLHAGTQRKKRNIGRGPPLYTAVHEFSYYRDHYGWKPADFPEAHFVRERIMLLPLFPMLTDDDQDDESPPCATSPRDSPSERAFAGDGVGGDPPFYNEEATLPTLFARLYPALDALRRGRTRSSSWMTAAATSRSTSCALNR